MRARFFEIKAGFNLAESQLLLPGMKARFFEVKAPK
jgi:hypothetical protein